MASTDEKDSDFKGRCSYCNTNVGRDKVKTCSRCRLVRYCSKECQVASWKTHKPRCTPRDSYAQDPTSHALNTALSRWINNWRDQLHTWSMWAFDLANHPPDRLATHCFVIELERRLNPPTPAHSFTLHGGGVESREGLIERLREIDAASDDTVACINERRGNDTAQIIVLCDDLIRFLWFSLRDGGASFRSHDQALSRAMATDWVSDLRDAIDTGDPASSKNHIMRAALRAMPLPT
ncbi:hypothetical protein BJ138DRAFT_284899 [Hygrophoropsis aurantiaca]|uniref:Uncharacterized protein n=1 Tax=Hygrophoropsis aurantiaca TaxID=72124 RepID=A0ACB8AT17_9AGAM|nr:hypothetical protein BJ138DRAFT_284899 [Hygrophoropsis aurantiaca]